MVDVDDPATIIDISADQDEAVFVVVGGWEWVVGGFGVKDGRVGDCGGGEVGMVLDMAKS